MGQHSRVVINESAVQRLLDEATERAKVQLQAKWEAFCAEAKGKPEDEIRVLVTQTWDGGMLSDEGIAALSRGEDVALQIDVRTE